MRSFASKQCLCNLNHLITMHISQNVNQPENKVSSIAMTLTLLLIQSNFPETWQGVTVTVRVIIKFVLLS